MGSEDSFVAIAFVHFYLPVRWIPASSVEKSHLSKAVDTFVHPGEAVWITNGDGIHFSIVDATAKWAILLGREQNCGRPFSGRQFSHLIGGHPINFCRFKLPHVRPCPVWRERNRSKIIVKHVITVLSYFDTLWRSFSYALKFSENFQNGPFVVLELGW